MHLSSYEATTFLKEPGNFREIWRITWVFPKIVVPQKWMVYNGQPYLNMDDLGENPLFSETST